MQELKALDKAVTAADQARREQQASQQKMAQLQPYHGSPRKRSHPHRGSPNRKSPSRQHTVTTSSDILQRQQQLAPMQQQQHVSTSVSAMRPDGGVARLRPPMPSTQVAADPQEQAQHVPAARRVLVDQQQKWQRISDWISRDSAEATVAGGSSKAASASSSRHTSQSAALAGVVRSSRDEGNAESLPNDMPRQSQQLGRPDASPVASIPDLRYSLDTAMMELELARNRVAVPHVSTGTYQVLHQPKHGSTVCTCCCKRFVADECGWQVYQRYVQQHLNSNGISLT